MAVPAPTGTADFMRLRVQSQRPLPDAPGARRAGPPHCLRQRRKRAPRPCHRAPARDCVRLALGARGASSSLSSCSRAFCCRGRRRGGRPVVRDLGKPGARGAVVDARYRAALQPRAGLARAWLHYRDLGWPRRCSLARLPRFAPPAFTRSRRCAGQGLAGRGRRATDEHLASLQIALSLMLVVAAGLFVQTFRQLLKVPLGFDSDRVLTATVDTARSRATPEADRLSFYQRLADAVRSVRASSTRRRRWTRPSAPPARLLCWPRPSGCKASWPRAGSPPTARGLVAGRDFTERGLRGRAARRGRQPGLRPQVLPGPECARPSDRGEERSSAWSATPSSPRCAAAAGRRSTSPLAQSARKGDAGTHG